ncbi:MAG: ATP-grasp domain-containing protein [Anaerolineae bacterium]
MSLPLTVVIVYRPFTQLLSEDVSYTVATDENIKAAQDALTSAGLTTHIIHVDDDIESVLGVYDPASTVIFNYCDGFADNPSGYDPITQVFERLGFAFTGADDATLQWSQDKAITKQRLTRNNIPTPAYQIYDNSHMNGWSLFPALVKPARQHGSLGISSHCVVETHAELQQQVERVLDEWKQPALVEDFIEGDEYRVSMIGNGKLEMLPLMRVSPCVPGQRYAVLDYETKWDEERARYDRQVQLDPRIYKRIMAAAKASFYAVDMRDYGAVDIRMRGDQAYVLDPNQNPDISDYSYFLWVAEGAGYDYSKMLARIVQLAAARLPRAPK